MFWYPHWLQFNIYINMPKNNLIAPDKISNKTTQFKTLEFKMLRSVGIWKVVKAVSVLLVCWKDYRTSPWHYLCNYGSGHGTQWRRSLLGWVGSLELLVDSRWAWVSRNLDPRRSLVLQPLTTFDRTFFADFPISLLTLSRPHHTRWIKIPVTISCTVLSST